MNKQNDEEYQKILSKALDEFNILTLGREQLSTKEINDLQEYARNRTNLKKFDEELTYEERAWKTIYLRLDSALLKMLGPDKKKEIDESKNKIEILKSFKKGFDSMTELGRNIEKLFDEQLTYIVLHFDKSENAYRTTETELSNSMLDQKVSNEEHKKIANAILALSNKYKELLVAPLQEINNKLQQNLSSFENNFKNVEQQGEINTTELFQKTRKWLSLSKELYLSRVMAITSIINQLELDTVLPKAIIEKGGKSDFVLSGKEKEDFFNKMGTYGVLIEKANSKENTIGAERKRLGKEIFGETEPPQKQTRPQEQIKPQISTKNSLEGKGWFRFLKVVYIGLWIIGIGISAFFISMSFWAFLISLAVVWLILLILKKAFYYIVLGTSRSKK